MAKGNFKEQPNLKGAGEVTGPVGIFLTDKFDKSLSGFSASFALAQ